MAQGAAASAVALVESREQTRNPRGMSSGKSSRSSRPTAGAAAGPKVNPAPVHDRDSQLEDKLRAFRADRFDADAYVQSKCQTMNEKVRLFRPLLSTNVSQTNLGVSLCIASSNKSEIRHLCSYLLDLKKASAEELRISVYSNYASFIRTSKEISDLEGELLSIRNLLSTQVALIHGLAEGVHVDSLSNGPDGSAANEISDVEDREPTDIEKWATEFPDILDVLLAERRVDEALAALDEGEHVVAEAKENKTLSPAALTMLRNAITEHRQKFADQLAEAACQPSTRGVELRAAVSALKRLGDGPRAHTLLLNAHYQRFQYNMQSLRPSSTSYGGAYTAALSQLVFSAIAQAASDSVAVFGDEPSYSSELVMWSTKQTETFALLVKRHALASSAAAGGLRAAAECVQIALGHCSLLESRGLALCPVLLKLFRPSVEQALNANLKRIEESTAALAAADDWVLTYPPAGTRSSIKSSNSPLGSGMAFQPKLSSSAHRFNSMVQDFFEDVGPLLSMQLGGQTLEGLFQAFNSYVNLLIKALPGSMEDEGDFEGSGSNKIVSMAETEAQQIALLANASLLADELLPRAAMKLSPLQLASGKDDSRRKSSDRQNRQPEQREWKRRLQRVIDGLRDSFCRQHALDLIFTEDGDTHLSAEMYVSMDGNVYEPEWFPSPIFQELFMKLTRMASIAADMFVGRERFATLLLMRLTETVILWLSDDQSFWDDIEEGPKPLGPLGLKQFYLDMEFVMLFASNGRYLSRNLQQVIKDIIGRAMNAFAATGMDPNSFEDGIDFYRANLLSFALHSVLPDDDWFFEISQEAINRLSGRSRSMNGDRDSDLMGVPDPPSFSVILAKEAIK
ncbi:Exocyst complex component exo84b [Asimina triloba]